MTSALNETGPKNIVIIGGGIIGISTAYFLTRHASYDPKKHSVTILEASQIAGGASGKAGGLIADWATPRCLAPLSFRTHQDLAKAHNGHEIWGFRNVFCAEVELLAQELGNSHQLVRSANGAPNQVENPPRRLDWILPDSLKSYSEIGTPANSGQVNPYIFTKTIARLAQEAGAKIVIGRATEIIFSHEDGNKTVESVAYTENDVDRSIIATDVLVASGPWSPRLISSLKLLTPRGHSVVVKPSRNLSPYILFPSIEPASKSDLKDVISPEIYPRPADEIYPFDTVYSSGPDDYEADLPLHSGSIEVIDQKCEDVWTALKSISPDLRNGEVLARQACHRAQIRKHEDDEEAGPIVGPVSSVKGLWLATGHDEWGIQNGPGTGLVMSEMIFDGKAKSADCESLHPRHFLDM